VTPGTAKRPRYAVAAIVCVMTVGIAIALVFVLSDNIVFFRTVTEAVHDRSNQGRTPFKLAGAVVPGSIHRTDNALDFEVTDGKHTVKVVHRGDQPNLFKPRVPVLCEGRWGKGLTFDSDRILIRHGAKYSPPKVDIKHAPKAGTA